MTAELVLHLPRLEVTTGSSLLAAVRNAANVVQKSVPTKWGDCVRVLPRGPQGEFEVPACEAVFGGPAKFESRNRRSPSDCRSGSQHDLPLLLPRRYRAVKVAPASGR
jgi:hypothetical protein